MNSVLPGPPRIRRLLDEAVSVSRRDETGLEGVDHGLHAIA
jgi:hypothetical protein